MIASGGGPSSGPSLASASKGGSRSCWGGWGGEGGCGGLLTPSGDGGESGNGGREWGGWRVAGWGASLSAMLCGGESSAMGGSTGQGEAEVGCSVEYVLSGGAGRTRRWGLGDSLAARFMLWGGHGGGGEHWDCSKV
eukprot:553244-Amphidinium_carterae.1